MSRGFAWQGENILHSTVLNSSADHCTLAITSHLIGAFGQVQILEPCEISVRQVQGKSLETYVGSLNHARRHLAAMKVDEGALW